MTAPARTTADRFTDAMTAAMLVAVDPAGLGGLIVRGGAGPIRDLLRSRLISELPDAAPVRRLPPSADMGRLDGGLDVVATLAAGRAIATPSLIAEAAHGMLVLPMAERLAVGAAARIARSLDDGGGPLVFAEDDGEPDEPAVATALSDRLALHVDLTGLSIRDIGFDDDGCAAGARDRLEAVSMPNEALQTLGEAAEAFGIAGVRPLLQAVRAARASAALAGRDTVDDEDLAAAARLVLAPRATRLPLTPEAPAEPPPPAEPETAGASGETGDAPLADRVVEAAKAAVPPDLLAALDGAARRPRRGEAGRRGVEGPGTGGGRPAASRPGRPSGAARLDILETLRAAVPFQRLRAAPPPGCRLALRASDLRIRRRRRPLRSTAIFVVDASGSSALHRLAEAKGAVESVLADAYVRRDRVAMIAFRGTGADVLLPPTGSLTEARRRLVDLPAGGGTPLASGLLAAADMARRVAAAGQRPLVILLTDGQANVAADGRGGRVRAEADALAAAGLMRAAGTASLLIDISDRPNPRAGRIADALGATWLPLPRADAARLAAAVRVAAAD